MAGWTKAGCLRGPAGPRGESVLSLGQTPPVSPLEGDVWLVQNEQGRLDSVAAYHETGTVPASGTYPSQETFPCPQGWVGQDTI